MNWKFWQKKQTLTNVPDDHQKTLTPTTINDENQHRTVLNLARRLQEGDALNIALTGPYGSGKSSILRTLMQEYPNYEYLSISLATLKSSSDKKGTPTDEEISTLNSRIEYSILQQLEYKEKQETLYNSRFKRVYHKASYKQLLMAFGIIVYAICLIIVFEPSFLQVEWICKRFGNRALNQWADICSLVYLFIATLFGVQKIIKSLGNSKLNKLNLKDGEIELKEDTSVFNKHLDEIIYFFQVTKYNVVILEDLDRFNYTEIFLKLREVNQLLNQSKAIGRKIIFIYAVRDDMFLDEERTKFFDYITTVIPIINSSNSADKMKEELECKGFTGLSDDIIETIAFFIDDMRLLKNIINEYAQYREKLGDNLDQNKLLAMIVYKNYHPKDFADLHKGEGVVYQCLHMKDELLLERNKIIDNKIAGLNHKIECLESTHVLLEKELRLIYIEAYRNKLIQNGVQMLVTFIVNNNGYTVDSIAANESIFNTFVQQDVIEYHYQSGYSTYRNSLAIKFSQIEKIVNSDYTYAERLTSIREGEGNYREQIKKLDLSRNIHYSTPIMQLLKNANMQEGEVFKALKVPKMLESFLKEGLINEDYFDYISFFFGKSINKHDHDFVLEMKLGHSKPYNYPIDKVDQCVKNIPLKSYNNVNILNIQVVDYISQHQDDSNNETKLNLISSTISRNQKWDFLLEFYRAVENPKTLIECIARSHAALWRVISRIKEDDMYEAWLRFVELEHSTRDSRLWIEENYAFMSKRINIIGFETATLIIDKGELVFSCLDANSDELLEYVVENCAYLLTPANVSCAFTHYRGERVDDFEHYPLNLTMLKNCKAARSITDYIYDQLNNVIVKLFITDAAKKEASTTIVELIENEKLAEETKRAYLSNQESKISFNDMEQKNWQLALELDLIKVDWTEIYSFFGQQGSVIGATLRMFISKHIAELDDTTSLSEAQINALAMSILLSSDFELPVYEKLISAFEAVTLNDVDISSVDDNHLKLLIRKDMIPYSDWYTENIRDNHPSAMFDYVDKHLDECLANIDNLPTNISMFKHLMNKAKVKAQYSLIVVQRYLSHIVWDAEIANLIAPCITSHLDKFDDDIELNLMIYASEKRLKQDLILASITKFQNDHSTITTLLVEMGEPYSVIADKSKKASLKETDMNRMILQRLQEVGYISSFSHHDEKFRVNHKRN